MKIHLNLLTAILLISSSSMLPAQNEKKELVILLHGLGRGKSIMTPMKEELTNEGFSVAVVDYRSIGRTPMDILADVTQQINAFRKDSLQTVHFVGHSLGGLMTRAYLDSNHITALGRVVLIGSPGKGTPFVDHFKEAWWLKLVGPAAASLGTDAGSFPRSLHSPYYPVGVIAGSISPFNNEDFIPGDDDGIVPVESTKLTGMTDFLLLNVNHSSLVKNETAIRQTIEFLKHGKFSAAH
ncbi:MAG: alpha/beta fold hydrolase [Bacteroidota bacterium]